MCKAIKRIEKEIIRLSELAQEYKLEGNLLWYYETQEDIENLKRVHKMTRHEIFRKILEIASCMFGAGKDNDGELYARLLSELEALLIGLNCPRKIIDGFHEAKRKGE